MKAVIDRYGISEVFHFTDKSNLELISENGGLLSVSEINRKGISVPCPGGNDWSHDADMMKGVDKYVHLAFIKDHPMLYRAKQDGRIQNPIWLHIDSSILFETGIRFCSDVSNKSGVPILDIDEAKQHVDFEVLFDYLDWKDPDIRQRRNSAIKSEILVPNLVPIEKIKGYSNG